MAAEDIGEREQSIAQLFRELSQESAALVRAELRQMRDELAQQGKRIGASGGLLGAAGVLGLGAFGALTAGLASTLGRGRPGRGALIVATLYGGGAAALALVARDRLRAAVADVTESVGARQRDAHGAAPV